jgi:hypothetical protein
MTNYDEYVKGLVNNTDEIREGREKGDNIFDKVITINNFLICSGDNGTYAEYVVAEDKEHFFFGGSVLTNLLTKIENDGQKDNVKANGLRVKLTKKKSEKGRDYVAVEVVPNDLPF